MILAMALQYVYKDTVMPSTPQSFYLRLRSVVTRLVTFLLLILYIARTIALQVHCSLKYSLSI